MANLKEIRVRIESIKSTQQITRAMKLVSAAKLRKAQDNIIQMRPYAQKLSGIMSNVTASLQGEQASAFTAAREVKKVLVVAVTSDRSLCGAFNNNIIKAVTALIETDFASQDTAGQVFILPVGKKGFEYFQRRNKQLITGYSNLFEGLSFDKARGAAERAMDGFLAGEFDKVLLVYNEFKNVATQIVRTETLIPIATPAADNLKPASNDDYLFEPSAEFILEKLIPQSIKITFYKALLESNASEHGARMMAMEKATENAGELLKELKLTYNRSRQAAITKEILEIVGGAEALAQS